MPFSSITKLHIHNNKDVVKNNILLLCDSYAYVVIPFLSLGIQDITSVILRSFDESLKKYIETENFDTIIIMYAEFMIGAHDSPSSANYKMFTLDN